MRRALSLLVILILSILFSEPTVKAVGSAPVKLVISKEIVRPVNYFRTHPEHTIPESMVIQDFTVNFDVAVLKGDSKRRSKGRRANSYSYQYELLESQGSTELLNSSNVVNPSEDSSNSFVADWYGPNVIKVTARSSNGDIVASVIDTTFVHFSHAQMAGGDINNLDKSYRGKEYITGEIEGEKLIYKGMRFLPSDISKGDKRYEGTKFGAYETKEPRVLALSSGTLIGSYHFQVKGSNDAPPGLTVVLARSLDGGKTWIDDQILLQDINGVVAYTSMVEWNGEVHCYFAGGHQSHQDADTYKGVYRVVSLDEGRTWSKPKSMDSMTKIIASKLDTIAPDQSPTTNALYIPDMEWKGEVADAYIVPFYVDPVRFLITLDGGESWDTFYDVNDYPQYRGEINEMSWALLDNRTIYVVSRRQSKEGYKNEMIFDLNGDPTFIAQSRKNHKARRCHQGAVKVPEGNYSGRVMVASNFSGDREEATLALSDTPKAENFQTKYLTTGSAWGYCHIDWNPKLKGFTLLGESEPFDCDNMALDMDGGPDRNERYNIESFAFSPEFYDTLVEADIHNK